jgi:hypothetical protein
VAGPDRRRHRYGTITGMHQTWIARDGTGQGADRNATPGDGTPDQDRNNQLTASDEHAAHSADEQTGCKCSSRAQAIAV